MMCAKHEMLDGEPNKNCEECRAMQGETRVKTGETKSGFTFYEYR